MVLLLTLPAVCPLTKVYDFSTVYDGDQMRSFVTDNDGWNDVACTPSGAENWGTASVFNIDDSEPWLTDCVTWIDASLDPALDSKDSTPVSILIDDPLDNGGGMLVAVQIDEDPTLVTSIRFNSTDLSTDWNDLWIRMLLYNFSGSNWFQCAPPNAATSYTDRSCYDASVGYEFDSADFINATGGMILFLGGDYDIDPGGSNNMRVDYVTLEVTYNSSPVIGNPTLDDPTPHVDDIIHCVNGSYYDAEGDGLTNWQYQWYNGTAAIAGATTYELNISYWNLTKHDNITCSVRANQSGTYSSWANSTTTEILNSIGTTDNPTLDTYHPYTNHTLVCTGQGFSDADNDTVSYWQAQWYLNDALVVGESTLFFNLLTAGRDKGDNVTCSLRASDGDDFTAWMNSSAAIIRNSAPVVTTSMAAQTANTSEGFTWDIDATDLDSDTLNFSINDTTLFTINSSTGVVTGTPNESQVGIYYFNLTVSDGDNVTWALFNITVLDTTLPRMEIQEPQNTTYTTNVSLPLNFTYVEPNVDRCMFRVVNDADVEVIGWSEALFCMNAVFDLPGVDDDYTIYLRINDTYGNVNISNVTFGIRMNAPSVVLGAPPNNRYSPSPNVTFSFTATDADNISECQLWTNFNGTWQANATITPVTSGVQASTTVYDIPEGVYLWNVWCNDTVGNGAFALANRTLTIDTTDPSVAITSPDNAAVLTSPITFHYNTTDMNILSCRYNFYTGGAWLYSPNLTLSCAGTSQAATLANGDYTLYVWSTDRAGNIANDSVSFSVTTSGGHAPAGGGGATIVVDNTAKIACNISIDPGNITAYGDQSVVKVVLTNNENFSITPSFSIGGKRYKATTEKETLAGGSEMTVSLLKAHTLNESFNSTLTITSQQCEAITVPLHYEPEELHGTFWNFISSVLDKLINASFDLFGVTLRYWYAVALYILLIIVGISFAPKLSPQAKVTVGLLLVLVGSVTLIWAIPEGKDVVDVAEAHLEAFTGNELAAVPLDTGTIGINAWVIPAMIFIMCISAIGLWLSDWSWFYKVPMALIATAAITAIIWVIL